MSGALTKHKIEQLAPDQASLSAALKLMKPAGWPTLARTEDSSLLWGECQGSGSAPYRVIVSPEDAGYKCTCPSRKFPCKHALAVMWMACEVPDRFVAGNPPDWVGEWQARRKPKPATRPPGLDGDAAPQAAKSLSDALVAAAAEAAKELDPEAVAKAAARAEAQRQRLKREREEAVLAGLDELDRWIVDQLSLGLAGFAGRIQSSARTLSARLVDAKAQGLAGRLDALAADIFTVPEPIRADFAIERLGALVLIGSAYRRQAELPPALQADVRRVVGWNQKREDLLADDAALRFASTWLVVAARSEIQPDKLRRIETWFMNLAAAGQGPPFALLVDFVPVSGGAYSSPFVTGETLSAEVVYYPSVTPLRALFSNRVADSAGAHTAAMPPASGSWPAAPTVADALGRYESALAMQPWIEAWPVAMTGVRVERTEGGRIQIGDGSGRSVPVDMRQADELTPLLGLEPISAVVLFNGREGSVLAADTPAGPWYQEA